MARNIQVVVPEFDLGAIPLRASVWHAKKGQRLICGDRLLEIWAGDVIIDIPAPSDGILRKLLVTEDESVVVGQPVAIIAYDG